jgi:hypothetical protein
MTKFAALVSLSCSALLTVACGDDGGRPVDATGSEVSGVMFGRAFTAADMVLAHAADWKSAPDGAAVVLISDTEDLCAQIESGKRVAPGRVLVMQLEQRDDDGALVPVEAGQFAPSDDATASSRYGDVFADAVDSECAFTKLFANQVAIDVGKVGDDGASVDGTLTAHYTNGEALAGKFSASASCDAAAVDRYLNASPSCE